MQNLEYVLNKGMKVFSQLYVGLRKNRQPPHLGFATPYEDNSAGRKRQETVDKWACGQGEYVDGKWVPSTVKSSQLFENVPREGFIVTDDVKRVYWGGGNVVWRIHDPYGFELEIQSANLLAIIQTAGIEAGGKIPGKCLWGRSGADNILLHESSEEYKSAILAAETLKKPSTIGTKDRVIGEEYLIMDGSKATYLGKFWITKKVQDKWVASSSPQPTPGIEINIDGWGSTYASGSTSKLEVADVYEALLFGKPSDGSVRLYKKAPLVRAENNINPKITIDTVEGIVAKLKLGWAAGGKNFETPVAATLEKPTSLNWTTVPATEAEVNSSMRGWVHEESSYNHIVQYKKDHPNVSQYDWMYNLANVFSSWQGMIFADGDKLFCHANLIQPRNSYFNSDKKDRANIAGPLVIDGPSCIWYQPDASGRSGIGRADNLKGFKFPDLPTPAITKAWIKEMLAAGKIVKIVPLVK